jgi:hypothetical protein
MSSVRRTGDRDSRAHLQDEYRIDVGYYNVDETRPPCAPLAGVSMNIDYRGRLVAVLQSCPGFAARLRSGCGCGFECRVVCFAMRSFRRWRSATADAQRRARAASTPDIYTARHVMFCLQSFGKIPWHEHIYRG